MERAPALGRDARRTVLESLIEEKKFEEIAAAAIRIESRTNLLFSFEKMALRDAVRSPAGAKAFALALFDFLYGTRADGGTDLPIGLKPSQGCPAARPGF